MGYFSDKFNEIKRKADAIEKGVPVQKPKLRYEDLSKWCVVKTRGNDRKVVGWNLTQREAQILVQTQKSVIEPDGDTEMTLTGFSAMRELDAKNEGLGGI